MTSNNKSFFPIIVIGGGHAGVEAATLASKFLKKNTSNPIYDSQKDKKITQKVALITMSENNLGQLSCNPSIGGVGKGVIAKEVDALGGIMGLATDASCIHFNMLNSSKGPAVWGPRAQTDRNLYAKEIKNLIKENDSIELIFDCVEDLIITGTSSQNSTKNPEQIGTIEGVKLEKIGEIYCNSCIICTGTFMDGTILRGLERIKAGRSGEKPSYLSKVFKKYNFDVKKLNTGTPPRFTKDSIDYTQLTEQPTSLHNIINFSALSDGERNTHLSCHIARTNEDTYNLMEKHYGESAIVQEELYKGPRYCPSMEVKHLRFPEIKSHSFFLEPEGLNCDLLYPSGMSNAFSDDIQLKLFRTIKGFENAEIGQYGYSIQYDFINPNELKLTLETKKIDGLFFAGQINGTTGYEEAAGQGAVAGINSALYTFNYNKTFIVKRSEGFIGVMIDDIVTKGVSEPYRMFTSRAEHRLTLRQDNADIRLTPKLTELDICDNSRSERLDRKLNLIEKCTNIFNERYFLPNQLEALGFKISQDGIRKNIIELLANRPNNPFINFDSLLNILQEEDQKELANIPKEVKHHIECEAMYKPFTSRQLSDLSMLEQRWNVKIPEDISYYEISSLSSEIKQKLKDTKPKTLGEAMQIEGVTPSAIISITLYLRKLK